MWLDDLSNTTKKEVLMQFDVRRDLSLITEQSGDRVGVESLHVVENRFF